MFRFTPAGLATRPDRSVTVAVRVDPATAGSIIVRGAIDHLQRPAPTMVPGVASLAIAPAAYNLGVARGYQGFAQNVQTFALAQDIRRIDMPDLSTFKPPEEPGARRRGWRRISPWTNMIAPAARRAPWKASAPRPSIWVAAIACRAISMSPPGCVISAIATGWTRRSTARPTPRRCSWGPSSSSEALRRMVGAAPIRIDNLATLIQHCRLAASPAVPSITSVIFGEGQIWRASRS